MKTKKLFDTNAYITKQNVKILEVSESKREGFEGLYEVITDCTIFAPEGGGQPADKGCFNEIPVEDVREFDGELIHFVAQKPNPGEEVTQSIDFELRLRRMQNHNAEHLLCGLIHKTYGYNNVGFHITENTDENGNVLMETTMDVDGPLDATQIAAIELEANRAIAENVKVYALLPDKEEAETIAYRSKSAIEGDLRLVVIEGYDICACCAPCLKSSGEMQLVKVLDFMPHRGGTRLQIVAGIDAVKDYTGIHNETKDIMKVLSSKRFECAAAVEKQDAKILEMHETIIALKKEITGLYRENLIEKIKRTDRRYVVFFADSLDEVQARTLINETVGMKECVIIVLFEKNVNGYRFVAGKNDNLTDVSLKNLAVRLREKLAARGGGSEQMIQGSINETKEKIEAFFGR